MTKITVVIPTHNSQQWIIETLESVRSQTYPRRRIETIVVDDGSNDSTAALARWFLARHAMQGSVLVADQGKGVAAAMNTGWKVATGDWIQFVNSGGLLAPKKFKVQASLIPPLPDSVGAICSSWQRLSLSGPNNWLPSGSVAFPELVDPIVLKLVSPGAGCLGAALFRKKAVEAVAGFSEETKFAIAEHFMLRIAGMGESESLMSPRLDIFVQAPSASPLFFERQMSDATSRHSKVGFAQQHLENVLIAQAMLLQMRGGTLMPEDGKEIADLCADSLSDLYEHNSAEFKKYSQWLGIDSGPNPTNSITSGSRYHESAEVLPQTRREITPKTAELGNAISLGMLTLKYRLDPLRHMLSDCLRNIGNPISRGIPSLKYGLDRARHVLSDCMRTIGNPISRGIPPLKYGLDRARHMLSDCLRTIGQAGVRYTAAFSATRPTKRVLAAGALIVIAPTALLAGMLVLGPFGIQGEPADLARQLQPSQKLLDGGPIIVVASMIYAEPSSSWPMPVEVGPPQSVPPDSVLHVHGLPPTATLSGGRRVSADVWAVPLVGLSNLVIHVATGVSGQSDLTLTLFGADGSILAKARTSLSIIEPTGTTTAAAASKDLSAGNQGGQEAEPRNGEMETLPEATAQTTESKPAHARTNSTTVELPAPLSVTEPSSSSQQAIPKPMRAMNTASSIISEPVRATEAPEPAQPSSAVAPAKLPQDAELATMVGSSRSTEKVTHNQGQEAAPEALADRAPRGATTASNTILEPSPTTATSITPEPPLVAAEPETQEGRRRAEKMMARGERDLKDGNVAGARQFFLRAAEAGLARGALQFAATYDPRELSRLGAKGIQPNPATARKWYERARQLGAIEAEERLVGLNGG
jgi:hypothetical protein